MQQPIVMMLTVLVKTNRYKHIPKLWWHRCRAAIKVLMAKRMIDSSGRRRSDTSRSIRTQRLGDMQHLPIKTKVISRQLFCSCQVCQQYSISQFRIYFLLCYQQNSRWHIYIYIYIYIYTSNLATERSSNSYYHLNRSIVPRSGTKGWQNETRFVFYSVVMQMFSWKANSTRESGLYKNNNNNNNKTATKECC